MDLRRLTADTLREAGLEFGELSLIELNRSSLRHCALAAIVFVDDAPQPVALVKWTPDPVRGERLEVEHANLTALHERVPAELRESVPRPLALGRHAGFTILAESTVPGTRMKNLPPARWFASRDFPVAFDRLVDWLGWFGLATFPDSTGGLVLPDAEVSVQRYREHFDRSAELDGLLDESLERVGAQRIRPVAWHGDFCTANVLLTEQGRVGVIDWEYRLGGTWPLGDLVYFLASVWCVAYRKGARAREENQRRMFFSRHRRSALVRRGVDRYLRGLDLDPELRLPLAVLAWVGYANRKRAELESSPGAEQRLAAAHHPLILIEGRRCLNLEMLAEAPARFLAGET